MSSAEPAPAADAANHAPVAAAPEPVVVEVEVVAAESFSADTLTVMRHRLASLVSTAGVISDRGEDFIVAVHELMTNAVRHGGGHGTVRLTRRGDTLTCDVVDHGGGDGSLLVRPPDPGVPGGRGLWLAQQLSDSLVLTRRGNGVTATVSVRLRSTPAITTPLAVVANGTGPLSQRSVPVASGG